LRVTFAGQRHLTHNRTRVIKHPRFFLAFAAVAAAVVTGCHRTPVNSELKPAITVAMVQHGDSLFHARSCVKCHGNDAHGAKNAPSLMGPTFLHVNGTYGDFVRIITSGVPKDSIKVPTHPFAMQPRGGNQNPMTDEEIRAVAAYVYSLSHPVKG
jgi:mono/diheme cytochrome c family protein